MRRFSRSSELAARLAFEAAMELLRHLPPKTGMAFVVVQHLDPHHASRLSKLLSKVTPMPVIELAETTTPRPNTVYVQPPNKCVIVKDGALKLLAERNSSTSRSIIFLNRWRKNAVRVQSA